MAGEVGTLISDCEKVFLDTIGTDAEKLITQAEWIGFLAEAESEICRRAFVLNTTSTITMVASTHTYSLSSHILSVGEKAYFNYDQSYMKKVTEEWLDRTFPLWRTTYGTPTHFVVYPTNDEMRVTPIPIASLAGYTLTLNIATLPVVTIAVAGDTPTISSKYYNYMKLYALYKAFSKHDVEVMIGNVLHRESDKYYAKFELSVGTRGNANIERITLQEPSTMKVGIDRR